MEVTSHESQIYNINQINLLHKKLFENVKFDPVSKLLNCQWLHRADMAKVRPLTLVWGSKFLWNAPPKMLFLKKMLTF